jgi:hypothetical protein
MSPEGTEPRRLAKRKLFHSKVRVEWVGVKGAAPEVSITDPKKRRRRIDILVDEGEDWVAVVEIKGSSWDRMRPERVRPNALRHARQVWRYVEPFFDRIGKDVCPGIIYEKVPTTPGRLEEMEAI